ncbi:MAG: DUF3300 domain-containing protein, partial [candidate division WS1 bacterium]|nr:DUF3300 domain-containing protein [candidate division WS1 bacterium]
MVGPIALYPDLLLGQMLPAATYPTEVTAAAEWVKTKGGEGLDAQPWDDTVKSVARYPDVLAYMAENMDWTTALGQAFINQRADVMDSIQQLRVKAQTTGALTTTPEQKVVTAGEYIIIEPAQPDVIYVPSYNPDVVYVERDDDWVGPLLTFGTGLLIGSWLDNDWYWPGYGLYHHGYPYWNWGWSSGHYHGWAPRGPAHWPGYRYPSGGWSGHRPSGGHGRWRNPSWAGGGRRGGGWDGRGGGRGWQGRGGQVPTGFEGGPGGRGHGRGPGVGGGPGGQRPGRGPGGEGGRGYRQPGPAPSVGGRVGGREPGRGPGVGGRPGGGAGTGAGPRTGRTGTPQGAIHRPGTIGAPYTRPPSGREAGRQGSLRGGAFGDYGRGSTAARSGSRGRQSISGAGGIGSTPTGRSAFGPRSSSGRGPSGASGVQRPASFGRSSGGPARAYGGGGGRMGGGGG